LPPALGIKFSEPAVFKEPSPRFLGHAYYSVENSALFDKEHRRNNIAMNAARFANLELGFGDKISANGSMNHAYTDIYLGLDLT
jgi:hypothetical protein